MDKNKEVDEECSDDDIFLSPGKKSNVRKERSERQTTPVQGIYEEKVKKMKLCLVGIPRPPAEPTSIHFNMEDVNIFVESSRLLAEESKCSNKSNPQKFDIYLNVDHSCEEIERLGAQYIKKFLPFETMSTMSDYTAYTLLTASAKKRRRCNGWATSPGSRLSYLARRKSTFSVDQVAKMGHPTNSKQFIMQRDQTVKGIKSVPLKPKRALFQSPEGEKKQNPYKTPEVSKRRSMRSLTLPSPNSKLSNQSVKEIKKQRSCRKSLEFSGDSEKSGNQRNNNKSSDKHVKRKLLWAVSTALKGVSVTSSHSKFKMCMNKLFKASLTMWNRKSNEKFTQEENSFSTSEAMLNVAKSLLDEVILPEIKVTKDEVITNDDDNNDDDNAVDSNHLMSSHTDEIEGNYKPCSSKDINKTSMKSDDLSYNSPISALAELTNSKDAINTPADNRTQSKSKLVQNKNSNTPEKNSIYSPLRNNNKSNSQVDHNSLDEFCSCNHKRKRDAEEEELMPGISSLECYQRSKLPKIEHHYR